MGEPDDKWGRNFYSVLTELYKLVLSIGKLPLSFYLF